jgi:hypothetical protein
MLNLLELHNATRRVIINSGKSFLMYLFQKSKNLKLMEKRFLVVGYILTVLDSKRTCRIHGLTEEELDEIDARLETSQRKTLAQSAW